MTRYKRKPPNEWDLLRLMDSQLKGVMAGYKFLTSVEQSQALSLAVVVGTIMLMGGFVESTRALKRIRPCTGPVIDKFKTQFDKWERMRDDAAHTAEKLYGSTYNPKRGKNTPWHKMGFRLLHYEPPTDTISTGSQRGGSFKLGFAIRCALSCSVKCDRALYLDEVHKKTAGRVTPKLSPTDFTVARKMKRLADEIQDPTNRRT